MPQYIDRFNELAETQDGYLGSEFKHWFSLPGAEKSDVALVKEIILTELSKQQTEVAGLVGECFAVVPFVSVFLVRAGIKHTVVIGDVLVDGESYFGATSDSIYADLETGYEHNKPIDAHTWITLEDGTIIDLTILASYATKQGRSLPELDEAIYISASPHKNFVHIPYHLGPEYVIKVYTAPDEYEISVTEEWIFGLYSLLFPDSKK